MLHHVGHGPPHYDLMLQRGAGGPLRTFRLAAWPVVSRQALVPLADHRRTYLDYEGEVSGGRGRVRRVEAGSYWGLVVDPIPGHKSPVWLGLNVHEIDGVQARRRNLTLFVHRDAGGTWLIEPMTHPHRRTP